MHFNAGSLSNVIQIYENGENKEAPNLLKKFGAHAFLTHQKNSG